MAQDTGSSLTAALRSQCEVFKLILESVIRALGQLRPSARRYRELLASCSVTPDDLSASAILDSRDVLICGFPRSGTALLAATLFQPPQIICAMEPWMALQVEPPEAFRRVRTQSVDGLLKVGRLDTTALRNERRVAWTRDGAEPSRVDANSETLTAIKWPGWWRWLGHFRGGRRIVTLRHPAEVVASFAGTGGRLSEGLEYDVALHRKMNDRLEQQWTDPARRRVALYDEIAAGLAPHLDRGDTFIVRYEDWFSRPEGLLFDLGEFLGFEVTRKVDLHQPSEVDPDTASLVAQHCSNAQMVGYDPADYST